MLAPHRSYHLRQPVVVELAVAKDIGSDDHLRGTATEPSRCVVGTDAAADLQTSGEGGQRLCGCVLVARAEHDDVAAEELVAAIARRKVRRRMGGDEVGLGALSSRRLVPTICLTCPSCRSIQGRKRISGRSGILRVRPRRG